MLTRYIPVFFVLLLAGFSTIAQPKYRLQLLKYERATHEYPTFDVKKKCTYHYSGNKDGVVSFDNMTPALNYKRAIQGLNYDYAVVEEKGISSMEQLCVLQQQFDVDGHIAVIAKGEKYAAPYGADTLQYDSSGNVVRMFEETYNDSRKENKYYYNAAGKMDSATCYWVNLKKYYSIDRHYYTSSGQLEKHIVTTFHPGNLTVVGEERYEYENNRVSAIAYFQNTIATSFDTVQTIKYEYDTAGDIAKQTMIRWDLTASTPYFSIITYYTYDAQKRLQNLLRFSGDAYGNQIDTESLVIYTYNSFGLPESLETRSWSKDIRPQFGIFDSVNKVRLWEKTTAQYELFWPTSIKSVATTASSLLVYPVPSSGLVNISVKLSEKKASVLYVSDVMGRMLLSHDMPAAHDYIYTLQPGELPAGVYTLSVEADGEMLTEKFVLK